MDFAPSPRAADLVQRVRTFVETEVEPAERRVLRDVAERRARGDDPWPPHVLIEELKAEVPVWKRQEYAGGEHTWVGLCEIPW